MMEKWVWCTHPTEAYVPASLKSSGDPILLESIDGTKISVSKRDFDRFDIAMTSSIQDDFENLTNLEEFTNGAVLHQLRKRYLQKKIYTWIGHILVSINPYEKLPLYTASQIDLYLRARDTASIPAHIFGVALKAFQAVQRGEGDQAFVISGESGAGKTEATKLVLQFLSEATLRSSGQMRDGDEESLEQAILQTNPLLESFGNSKTVRNNNSSRFGKWMEIKFTSKDSRLQICGASILNYLLEKSRVVKVATEERTYHIFYQMVQGFSKDEENRRKFKLKSIDWYRILNSSKCLHIPGVSDANELEKTMKAMRSIKLSSNAMDDIFSVLSAILLLGNLKFVKHPMVEDSSALEYASVAGEAAGLLHVEHALLEQALMFRKIQVSNSVHHIPLKVLEAEHSRDSICKDLYGKLFDWIVLKTNEGLARGASEVSSGSNETVIGVLDIFGFEIFEHNSFEQFCINFTNEKLQQYFTTHIFKMEQEEYKSDGVSVEFIDFEDNMDCLALIEGKRGIISILDEQIVMPKGSDEKALQKMHDSFATKSSPNVRYAMIKQRRNSLFVVNHYAGSVSYHIRGFLEKNSDKMSDTAISCLRISTNTLVSELYNADGDHSHITRNRCSSVDAQMGSTDGGVEQVASRVLKNHPVMKVSHMVRQRRPSAPINKKKPTTICAKFTVQLSQLLDILKESTPHFIRCIKPNEVKKSGVFDSAMSFSQMKYAGLMEAIRVRASGFAMRQLHGDFAGKFRVLLGSIEKNHKGNGKLTVECERIIKFVCKKYTLDPKDFAIGTTKVFYRNKAATALDMAREEAVSDSVIAIQRIARGYIARKLTKRRRRVFKQCKAAIDADDYDALVSVVSECDEHRFVFSVLETAKSKLKVLEKARRIMDMLSEAMGRRDIDMLEEILAKLDSMEYLPVNFNETIEKAKSMLTEVNQHHKIKQQMNTAIEEEDYDSLKDALETALSLGSFRQQNLTSPQVVLRKLAKEKKTFERLDEHMGNGDFEAFLIAFRDLDNIRDFFGDKSKQLENSAKIWASTYVLDTFVFFVQQKNVNELKKLKEQLKGSALEKENIKILQQLDEEIEALENGRESSLPTPTESETRSKQKSSGPEKLIKEVDDPKEPVKVRKNLSISFKAGNVKERMGMFLSKFSKGSEKNVQSEQPRRSSGDKVNEKIAALASQFTSTSKNERRPSSPENLSSQRKSTITLPPPSPRKESIDGTSRSRTDSPSSNSFRLPQDIQTTLKALSQEKNLKKVALDALRQALYDMNKDEIQSALIASRDEGVLDCVEIKEARSLCYGMDSRQFLIEKIRKFISQDREATEFAPLVQQAAQLSLEPVGDVKKAIDKVAGLRKKNKKVIKGTRGVFLPYRNHAKPMKEAILHNTFSIENISGLRSEENFTKRLWRKGKFQHSMLSFSPNNIPRSLFHFSLFVEDKKTFRELEQKAKQVFQNILYFQDVHFHAYPTTAAEEVLRLGLEIEALRDEIYMQLIKQSTNAPDAKFATFALRLMFLCLSQFLPVSENVQEVLETHLCKIASKDISRFSPMDEPKYTATFCFEALRRGLVHGVEVSKPLTLNQITDFYNMQAQRLAISISEDGKVSKPSIVSFNLIPESVRHIFPFERHAKAATANDLVMEICRSQNIPRNGRLHIINPPEVVEMKLEDDGMIDETTSIETFLQLCADSDAQWVLKLTKEQVSPLSFIIGANTALEQL